MKSLRMPAGIIVIRRCAVLRLETLCGGLSHEVATGSRPVANAPFVELPEGEVAELVEHDEVEAAEQIGGAALAAIAGLGVELVHEVDDVEEASPGAAANAGAHDADGEVGLAGARAADQDEVALLLEE